MNILNSLKSTPLNKTKQRRVLPTTERKGIYKKLNITHYAKLVLASNSSTEATEEETEESKARQVPMLYTHRHSNLTTDIDQRANSKEIVVASHPSSRKNEFALDLPKRNYHSKRISINLTDKSKLNVSASNMPSHKNVDLSNSFTKPRKEELIHGKLESYSIIKSLGRGAYAVVKEAYGKSSKKKCAIKIYEKYKVSHFDKKRAINNEIKLLTEIVHPNIALLYEAIETPNQVLLIMEYFHGMTLNAYAKSKRFRRLNEAELKKIFRQLLSSVHHCHQRNICHRDLKLDNVLINKEGIVKLIDFGFSYKCRENELLKVFCGTPAYMSPEIVSKVPYNGKMADMWALGVVLYVLLSGYYPFKASSDSELYCRISKGFYNMPEDLSVNAKQLISNLLVVDPLKRWTAEQALAHDFMC
jgi:tRNA A-37 threonylcarbamoyl transferase component Bud32